MRKETVERIGAICGLGMAAVAVACGLSVLVAVTGWAIRVLSGMCGGNH